MAALLRLVSLGSAARNAVKIKVRQPLAELKVQPADERDRSAVERFADQIIDELNLKRVTLHDPSNGPLARPLVKLNMKSAGPKLGAKLKEVQAALAAADMQSLAAKLKQGSPIELQTSDGPVVLDAADLQVSWQAPEGWVAIEDKGTILLLDSRVTDDLKLEGLAREVVRCVQNLRKDANLQLEDRIVLHLHSAAAPLASAIERHREYLAAETLTTSWSSGPLGNGAATLDIKIDGHALHVELRKV
jgi:isoleucyl-tRNA synthetase